jgi:hypothetical protein
VRLAWAGRTALPVLAALLLAAHFYRGGLTVAAGLALGLAALAFVPHRWARRWLQAGLAAGVLVWLHTAWVLATGRAAGGLPYGRLLAILGVVAAVTAVAAWWARPVPTDPD